jgi:hypothetical protein
LTPGGGRVRERNRDVVEDSAAPDILTPCDPYRGSRADRLHVCEREWTGLTTVDVGEAVLLGQCRRHEDRAGST